MADIEYVEVSFRVPKSVSDITETQLTELIAEAEWQAKALASRRELSKAERKRLHANKAEFFAMASKALELYLSEWPNYRQPGPTYKAIAPSLGVPAVGAEALVQAARRDEKAKRNCAILKRAFRGWSHSRTAKKLGISVRTVQRVLTAARQPHQHQPTKRYPDIIGLSISGKTQEQVAADLGCSVRTVRRAQSFAFNPRRKL